MNIFAVQHFSLHDGPGVRTTIFTKGCPLRCAWCHNPESQRPETEYLISREKCLKCGLCPGTALAGQNVPPRGDTYPLCPQDARRTAGRTVSQSDLIKTALKDKLFYESSRPGQKGGVTIGGGEPLNQWQEVKELSHALRMKGVHTALDTSGFAGEEIIREIPDHFDLVILDFKALSPGIYDKWIGVKPDRILRSLEILTSAMGERLWITIPLIPGVQTQEELRGMKAHLDTLSGSFQVRLIPYHAMGGEKYGSLGRERTVFSEKNDLYEYACGLWNLTQEQRTD